MASSSVMCINGKKIILDRAYNSAPTRTQISQFKIGIGTTTPVVADTAVEHPVPLQTTEAVDSCDATTSWTDSADMTVHLNTTTYKEGTGSLDLTKDGTASATASTSKATTSLNFTSKELSIWIYIKDTTTLNKLATTSCLDIRFGSDSSNYYKWLKDKSELAVGWNLLDGLTSANADATQGTPTISACDYTYIGLTATGAAIVWVDGDIMMDDIKLISTGDYLKNLETNYPAIDYSTYEVTSRARIPTTSAIGYNITEFGLFNADGTPLLESHDVFTAVSKSSSDEIIIEAKTILL